VFINACRKELCRLRPGLDQISYGFNAFHFSVNHTDVLPTTSRCIDLLCPYQDRRDDQGYHIPEQLEKVLTETSVRSCGLA